MDDTKTTRIKFFPIFCELVGRTIDSRGATGLYVRRSTSILWIKSFILFQIVLINNGVTVFINISYKTKQSLQ